MRLFIALPLPNAVRSALAQICGGVAGTRWIEPENFHITMRFVGNVGRGEVDDLHTELSAIRFPEFEIALRGIGLFERRSHVHMLWAGIDMGESVIELHDRIETAVLRAGLPREPRKFKPHITLCRFKPQSMPDIGPFLEMNNAFSTPPFTIGQFNLYQSQLGHGGARYDVLSEYPLEQMVYYGEEAAACVGQG